MPAIFHTSLFGVKSNKQIVNSMFRRESFYSEFPKVMLGNEMVNTIYNRQNESSASEQINRPLGIFTFLLTNVGLLVKKKSWPNF